MFHAAMEPGYLELCEKRVRTENLVWVEQFLDLFCNTDVYMRSHSDIGINDIGCNLGQFLKGARNRFECDYFGFDIEPIYLERARLLFPSDAERFVQLDIQHAVPEPQCLAVMSATLEHLEYLHPGLDNFIESAREIAILRTFMGDTSIKALRSHPGASASYFVNQYSFLDVLDTYNRHGFNTVIVRDKRTDSLPIYLGQGLVRTQYIVFARRRDRQQ